MTLTTFRGLVGPSVTAVGGTTGYAPDSAAKFSGGGFSNYFDRPPFQKFVVGDYLEQLGDLNLNFYKCVYFCDLTSLMLQYSYFVYFIQPSWPRRPRPLRGGL
jgi:hypothetical protein